MKQVLIAGISFITFTGAIAGQANSQVSKETIKEYMKEDYEKLEPPQFEVRLPSFSYHYTYTNVILTPNPNRDNQSNSRLNDLLQDESRVIIEKWCYPGGDMEPAQMLFWSNGLLEVRSELFDKQKQPRYFTWNFPTPNSLHIESFGEQWDTVEKVEQTHPDHIWSINENSESIYYRVYSNSKIFFLNWAFFVNGCKSNRTNMGDIR